MRKIKINILTRNFAIIIATSLLILTLFIINIIGAVSGIFFALFDVKSYADIALNTYNNLYILIPLFIVSVMFVIIFSIINIIISISSIVTCIKLKLSIAGSLLILVGSFLSFATIISIIAFIQITIILTILSEIILITGITKIKKVTTVPVLELNTIQIETL